jgi:hypothetical protein
MVVLQFLQFDKRMAAGRARVLPRDAYMAQMEAQLMGWAHELAWLRSKAAVVATRGSVEFQLQLAAAQGKHQAVRHKFEKLKSSGEKPWNALAAGLEVAWTELTA